ncbi:MAG: FAD-dependent oxidoreductase [Planctomycetaceae bacterium]
MIDTRSLGSNTPIEHKRIVIIGNGYVGHHFCQKILELQEQNRHELVVFSEEKIPAYDRLALANFCQHRTPDRLLLSPFNWYEKHGIKLHLTDRVLKIDRTRKQVLSSRGVIEDYDHVVLATGSYSYVPPIAGIDQPGVHLFRTLDDMEEIIADRPHCRSVAVIGGGLFGLEAARAVSELGLETHIIESNSWVMHHQLDETGSSFLKDLIESQGVQIHLNKQTSKILSNNKRVCGLQFQDQSRLEVDMVIFAAGIRPRDELARICQLQIHETGGVVVNNQLQTSDPNIFAIGKGAHHPDIECGLVSPGLQMADVLASNLCGIPTEFCGIEQAVKRNVLGVDVACFGNQIFSDQNFESVTYRDPNRGIYRKLFINPQGTQILGGILIGDTTDYDFLLSLMKSQQTLTSPIDDLLKNKTGSTEEANLKSSQQKIESADPTKKVTRRIL